MNQTVRYAGFWRRVGAHLIDSVIYTPLALMVLLNAYGLEYFAQPPPSEIQGMADLLWALVPKYQGFWDFTMQVLLPLALVLVLWRRFGATPGKRLLHLRVVDALTLGPIGWRQSALRSLGYLIALLTFAIPFLWILRDPRKQGLHDKLAGTVVIHAPEDEARKSITELVKESQ